MTSPKTTIAGALLAGLTAVSVYQSNGGKLDDWKLWTIPAAIAVLTFLTKDSSAK